HPAAHACDVTVAQVGCGGILPITDAGEDSPDDRDEDADGDADADGPHHRPDPALRPSHQPDVHADRDERRDQSCPGGSLVIDHDFPSMSKIIYIESTCRSA